MRKGVGARNRILQRADEKWKDGECTAPAASEGHFLHEILCMVREDWSRSLTSVEGLADA